MLIYLFQVIVFSDSLIPTVRKALIDTLPEVRQCAAQTFDHLHGNIGPRALDEILPYLLKQLNNPDLSELALDGLRQVMSVKSRVVLPYLVPQVSFCRKNVFTGGHIYICKVCVELFYLVFHAKMCICTHLGPYSATILG